MIAFLNLSGWEHWFFVPYACCSARATALDALGNFKPILPGYFANPTIQQFGDTFSHRA